MVHLSTTIEQLRGSGVALVSLSESWVNTADASPLADLVRNILGSVAEFERSLIADRVRAGMQRAKAQGKALERPRLTVPSWDNVYAQIQAGQLSRRDAAKVLGISRSSVSRLMYREMEMGFWLEKAEVGLQELR